MNKTPSFSARRGFTMTELAIVLAIIGLILGAIWMASARVNTTNKNQKVAEQTLAILNGYQSLYAQHGIDTATWTDVTCLGVNSGFFPADMVPGTCTTSSTGTYPIPSWGDGSYTQVLTDQTNQGVIIGFINLSKAGCIGIANAVINGQGAIMGGILSTGTATSLSNLTLTPTVTLATINSKCTSSTGNAVYVDYQAK